MLLGAAGGAWGLTYTWTGGGGADTSWTNASNWGGSGYPSSAADTAIINGNYTVTLTGAVTVGTLDLDYSDTTTGLVVLNLDGYTLTATTVNFGKSSDSGALACTVTIVGSGGEISTGTLDTNEYTNNTVYMEDNSTISISGTYWSNQNNGTTTTFIGDGTANTLHLLTGSSMGGTESSAVFDDVTLEVGSNTYSLSTSGAAAPGKTVTVTVSGTFPAQLFRYEASVTGTGETYTLYTQTGTNGIAISSSVTTQTSFSPSAAYTSSANSFVFEITYPSTVANNDGFVLTLFPASSNLPIGSVSFTQSSSYPTWTGGGSSTDWNTGTNWSIGAPPSTSSATTITIPSGCSYYPVLTTGVTVGSGTTMTVDSGASFNFNGYAVSTLSSLVNNGTVYLAGTESTVASSVTNGASSTVEYDGGASATPVWGSSYCNLTVDSGCTLTASSGISVSGAFTDNSSLSIGNNTLSFASCSGTGSVSTSLGTITQTGASASTLATLSATTGATINGSSGGLTIGTLSGTGIALSTSGTVALNSTGLSTLTVNSGTLNLSGSIIASGLVSNSGSIAVGANTLSFGSYSGGSGSMSMAAGTLTKTGTASLSTINSLTMSGGTNYINGDTSYGIVLSGASYTSAPGLTTTGLVSISAGTLGALAVNNGTLTLSGAITAATANIGNGTAAAAVTNTGALTVSGATTINILSGNSLSLANTANDFQGTVTVTSGGAISLVDENSISLGAATMSGAYTITAGSGTTAGSVSGSGVLNVGGTLSVTAYGSIALSGANTTSAVSLINSSTTAGNISYNSAAALSLSGSNAFSGGTFGATASAGSPTLTVNASNISTNNGVIALQADSIALTGTVNSGTANTYLYPSTSGLLSSLGGSSSFNLSSLVGITAGAVYVGANSSLTRYSGTFTIGSSAAVSASGKTVYVYSTADIEGGTNAITASALYFYGVSGIGSGTTVSTVAPAIVFGSSTSGNVSISDAGASASATSFSGTAPGTVYLTETGSYGLSIGGTISSTTSGAVTLKADAITIGSYYANATATGTVYLLPYTSGTAISMGGSTGFYLTGTALSNFTAGTLVVGEDSTPTVTGGAIAVAANVSVSGKNLMLAGTSIAENAGRLTTGTGTLTLWSSGGIGAASAILSAAAAVSFTNSSGAVSVSDNRAAGTSFSGTNSAASGGTVTLAQTGGALTVGGSIISGTGAYVSLSSAGAATQSAAITAPGGLLLLGAGSFTLTGANVVSTIAASTTGAVSFNSSAGLAVGPVNSVSGITTTAGAVTLTTGSGDLTISQPIDTSAGSGYAITLTPAGSIYLNVTSLSVAAKTASAAVTFSTAAILDQNSKITGGTGTTNRTAFSSTLNSASGTNYSLTVNSDVLFSNTVGSTYNLSSLNVTGATTLGASCTAISTTAAQTYSGNVTLGAGVNFTGGSGNTIDFGGTLGGASAYSVTITAANVEFDNAVGGVGHLVSFVNVTAGTTTTGSSCTTITTSSYQTYAGNVTITTGVNFTGGSGSLVKFGGTLGSGSSSTGQSVAVTTANAEFDGSVGGSANLVTSVDVTAGTTTTGSSVISIATSGLQYYFGTFTLGNNVSTITGAGNLTFNGAVTGASYTLTVQNSSSTGPVALSGTVTLSGLTTGAGAYNVSMTGTGSAIASLVAFLNGGALVLGQSGGTITFTGGLETTGNTTNPSPVTLYGTIASNNAAIVLGAVTLGATTIVNTAATSSAGTITIGAVTGGTYSLTLETGSSASNANVSGTSFAGTGTLILQNIGGTASFSGAVTVATLTVANTVLNVSLGGASGTVTSAVNFLNTGTLSLGASGGTLTFTGGITTTGVGGIVTLYGTIATSNAAIAMGAVSLGANTVLTTAATSATGTITIGAVSGGSYVLELYTGPAYGGITFNGAIAAGYLRIVTPGSIGSAGTPLTTTVSYFAASAGGLINLANTSALTIGFTTGTYSTYTGVSTSSGGAIALASPSMSITENVSGSGTLTLEPYASSSTVSIGAGATSGAFNLGSSDLNYLVDGFSSITIGRSDSSTVSVGGFTFKDPITILGGGTITLVSGETLATSEANTGITLTASIGAGIAVNGAIQATGTGSAVSLTGPASISMTSGSSIATGTGTISLASASGSVATETVSSTGNGQISITAGTSISDTDTSALVGYSGGSSLLVLSAGSTIGGSGSAALKTAVGVLRLSAAGAAYISQAGGMQLGNATSGVVDTGGLVSISATGALTTGNTVTTSSGSVTITTTGSLTISNGITTTSGSGGSISLTGASVAFTAPSANRIGAANNSAISVTATSGSIADTGAAATTLGASASTSTLALSASTGIGTSSAARISTDVGTIEATTVTVGVFITEASAVQLGDATAGIQTTTSGSIYVTAGGAITTGTANAIGSSTAATNVYISGTTLTLSCPVLAAGIVNLSGSSSPYITVGASVTGGTGLMTFNNAVSHSAGTITCGSGGALFSGNYTQTTGSPSLIGYSGASIEFDGSLTFLGSTYFTNNSDTAIIGGTAAQTIAPNGAAFNALSVTKSGGTATTGGSGAGSFSATSYAQSGSGGSFSLASTDTMTVSGSLAVTGGTLTLNGAYEGSGATFSVGAPAGTVYAYLLDFITGAMTVGAGGTFVQYGVNTSSDTVASLTVSSSTGSCTWDSPASGGTLTIGGNLDNSAGGTLYFNDKDVTIGGTIAGTITFYDLIIPTGRIVAPGGSASLTVLRNLTIQSGGTYTKNGNPLTLGGGTVTSGTITDSNATKNDLGTVALVAGGGATTKTMGSGLLMDSLSIGASVSFDTAASSVLTVNGSIGGSGSLVAESSSSSNQETIAIGGSMTGISFTPAYSKVVFNGSSAAATANYTFYDLVMDMGAKATTLTPSAGIAVTDSFTQTEGTFVAGSYTHSIAGDWDSYTSGSGTNVGFSSGTSTIQMTSTAPNILTASGLSFNNLTLQRGGTLGTNVTVTNNFIAANSSSGNLTLGTYTLNVANGFTLTSNATLAAGSSTVNLNGTTQAISTYGQSLYNLTLASGSGTATEGTGALNVGGALEVQPGRTLAMGAYALAVTGATNATAGAVGTITSSSGTQSFSGSFKLGTLTASNSSAGAPYTCFYSSVTFTTLNANGGTIQLTGSANQALATNNVNFYNLWLAYNTAGKTVTVSGALNVGGNLEVGQSQTLDLATNNVNLSVTGTTNATATSYGTITAGNGSLAFTGGFEVGALTASSATASLATTFYGSVTLHTLNHHSGTVYLAGSAGNPTFSPNGVTFNNLNVTRTAGTIATPGGASGNFTTANYSQSGAGGTFTLASGDTMTVSSSLAVTSGTLNLNGVYAGGSATFGVGTSAGAVNVAASNFTAGALSVTAGGTFAQTGSNTSNLASLSVSGTGASCGWGSGSLTVSSSIAQSGGTLNLGSETIGAQKVNVTAGTLALGTTALSLSAAGNVIAPTSCTDGGTSTINLNGAGNFELNTGSTLTNTVGAIVVNADTTLVNATGGTIGTAKALTISSSEHLYLDSSPGGSNTALTLYLGNYTGANTAGILTATGTLRVANSSSSNPITISAIDATNHPFTYSGTDVDYNGLPITIDGINASALAATVGSGASLTLGGANTFSSMTVSGSSTLTFNASEALSCGAFTANSGTTISNVGANTLTASGNATISCATTAYFITPTNSTLVMSGTGTLNTTPPIGSLEVSGTATLASDVTLMSNVTIDSSGTLNAGSYKLTFSGNWTNNDTSGGFVPGTGKVIAAKTSGTVVVNGSNTWYDFTCTVAGLTIEFENTYTQTFSDKLTLTGNSGNYITITRETNSGTPGNPYSAADLAADFWNIYVPASGTMDLNYVTVSFSNASSSPITVGSTVNFGYGSPYYDNYWLSGEPLFYSYTEDSDGNGKIDRIRVQAFSALNMNFTGFQVSVTGYTVTGYSASSYPNMFYINLKEQGYTDTGVTPTWNITKNTTLAATSSPYPLASQYNFPMTPIDTAAPRIAYTLTLPNNNQVFVHMSEPVKNASFSCSAGSVNSTTAITTSGGGTSEFLLTLGSTLTSAMITAGTYTITEAGSAVDLGTVPTDAYTLNYSYPHPSYPTTIGSYSTYQVTSTYGGSGIAPPYGIPSSALSHRVSDVLVSEPMTAAANATYFVWPIYAKDDVLVTLSDAQIAALTATQTAAEGIGLIRAFDGSQWLRAQDITLQARLQPTLTSAVKLWFDSNVSSDLTSSTGLWLPTFAQTDFSGLAPYPDASPWGRGATSVDGTAVATNLYDFKLPASNPRIVSVSTLGFFFTLAVSPTSPPLYVARLDMTAGTAVPANWYYKVKPFSFIIHDVTTQRGGVTILSNVIDPTKGDTVKLSYQLQKSGAVTATVFTLDGDVVARLVDSSNQSAGDYSVSWNGKNLGGRPVARGLYFIRIVGPGMDEIRKVLVVRK
jgi:hypothetical protein